MPSLKKLFHPFPAAPLPEFAKITLGDIPVASSLLFYNGNKLTEKVGNRLYEHPYWPPAFHAALYIGDGLMLNVGKFKKIVPVKQEMISTRRVDVITYKMPEHWRGVVRVAAMQDTDSPKFGLNFPTYAVTDFLRFGLKWFKPSKSDFCSENVVELLGIAGVKCSDNEPFNTAPWDLLEFAMKHQEDCEVRTLWEGPEFSHREPG